MHNRVYIGLYIYIYRYFSQEALLRLWDVAEIFLTALMPVCPYNPFIFVSQSFVCAVAVAAIEINLDESMGLLLYLNVDVVAFGYASKIFEKYARLGSIPSANLGIAIKPFFCEFCGPVFRFFPSSPR